MQDAQVSIFQSLLHGAAHAALHMLVSDACTGPALTQMPTKTSSLSSLPCTVPPEAACVGTPDLPSTP